MNLYDDHKLEDHASFLMDDLVPAMVGYADHKGAPVEVVAFAVFMATAAMITSAGVSREAIIKAVNAMKIQVHDAPEGLQ